MDSAQAGQASLALAVFLLLAMQFSNILAEICKAALGINLAGAALSLLPFEQIDEWSQQAAGWTNIANNLVPWIGIFALVGLNSGSLPGFIAGFADKFKLVVYGVAGPITAGSAQWVDWQSDAGEVVGAILNWAISTLQSFTMGIGQA